MVYDPKLKKTVLFGGYFGNNFRNDTWTWNGTAWTEVKLDNDERPPNRSQMAMWYDPLQQKVILYGGIGRGSVNEQRHALQRHVGLQRHRLDEARSRGNAGRALRSAGRGESGHRQGCCSSAA